MQSIEAMMIYPVEKTNGRLHQVNAQFPWQLLASLAISKQPLLFRERPAATKPQVGITNHENPSKEGDLGESL